MPILKLSSWNIKPLINSGRDRTPKSTNQSRVQWRALLNPAKSAQMINIKQIQSCSPQCVCTESLLQTRPFPALEWECNAASPLLRRKSQMLTIFHWQIRIQTLSLKRRNASHTPPETSYTLNTTHNNAACFRSPQRSPQTTAKDTLLVFTLNYFPRAAFLLFRTELHKTKLQLGVISDRESIQSFVCFEQARIFIKRIEWIFESRFGQKQQAMPEPEVTRFLLTGIYFKISYFFKLLLQLI